jgi:hypothetical protein
MENQYFCSSLGWRSLTPFFLPIVIYIYARIEWKIYLSSNGKYIWTAGVALGILISLHRLIICQESLIDFIYYLFGFLIVIAGGSLISWIRHRNSL